MISHFLNFEKKHFFRSMFWQKSIVVNILLGFFALYFLAAFLLIGIGGYYALKKEYPLQDPLVIVNSILLFVFFSELIIRYLMQKMPVMNIKPMLLLPVKKSKLLHYLLTKSIFSFFNIVGLFFYVPFAIILIKEGYSAVNVLGWLFGLLFIILTLNYSVFLINKSKQAFAVLASVLLVGYALQYFKVIDVAAISKWLFNGLYDYPVFILIPLFTSIAMYFLNYKQLKGTMYLDEAIVEAKEAVSATDLSFVNRFGDLAPFLKNDMRLIWRNKRPKTVFLMSFAFLLYALIFFSNPVYEEKMPAFLVFATLFVTGGFIMNFGQFIPAWDSAYYKMIMSQNIAYRKFLESKWLLMVVFTGVLYILSIPYLFFGVDKFLMITAGAIFNIGFNALFVLFAGAFNRKRIDLSKGGFGNTQGMSAMNFLLIIPMAGPPILLFWLFNKYISFNAGIMAIAAVGIIALVLKKYAMRFIEKKYIENKYATIHAFNQKN